MLQLFDHIADCIGKFVRDHNLTGHTLPLGFTFSFPCKQEGLAKARLSKWTKGFRCEGVVGEDICALLHEALKRRTVGRLRRKEGSTGLYVRTNHKGVLWTGRFGGSGNFVSNTYSLHCHHQNDSALRWAVV